MSPSDGYDLKTACMPVRTVNASNGSNLFDSSFRHASSLEQMGLLQLQANRDGVAHQVCLEYEKKEVSEVLKHLDEDVPVQADVWC